MFIFPWNAPKIEPKKFQKLTQKLGQKSWAKSWVKKVSKVGRPNLGLFECAFLVHLQFFEWIKRAYSNKLKVDKNCIFEKFKVKWSKILDTIRRAYAAFMIAFSSSTILDQKSYLRVDTALYCPISLFWADGIKTGYGTNCLIQESQQLWQIHSGAFLTNFNRVYAAHILYCVKL